MKKIKWLFGIGLIFIGIFCGGIIVKAENSMEYIRSGDFSYIELKDGTISIYNYYGTDETVIVPSEIDGKKVSEICEDTFIGNDKIKHITVQDGIDNIRASSFKGCKNLESIYLPDSIRIIEESAFSRCRNLTSISLPSSVEKIEKNVFEYCSKLKTIDIPNSVKIIENAAFSSCINLESVSLPNGIENISSYTFYDCKKLKSINIPSSVKSIGQCAFKYCESLESIIIPNSVTAIGLQTFKYCKSLTVYADSNSPLKQEIKVNDVFFNCINHPQIIKDNDPLPPTCTQDGKTEGCHCPVCDYIVPAEIIKATGHSWDEGIITLEPTVTEEGEKLFTCKTCKTIKTEKIAKLPLPQTGNTITHSDDSYKVTKSGTTNGTVQYSATKKSKTTITIPDTVTINEITYKVTAVSKNAFKNNKKLKKVIIGKNVTKIEANAFNGCKNLKTITVKSSKLKSVGKNAFKGIHKYAKIKVPASKLKKYKKLMSKKGQKSTVKIVK